MTPDATADRPLVQRGQLHEQVVRMLPVVQRLALERLTALEQQRIATGPDGQRLGARHAVEVEGAAAELAHRHQHAPVDAAELIGTARTPLVVVLHEGVAVQHHHPSPAMKCQARIADASGSQAVPEPIRVMGIPNGRSGIMRGTESLTAIESAAGSGWWPACGFSWASSGSAGRNAPSATASVVALRPDTIDPPSREPAE